MAQGKAYYFLRTQHGLVTDGDSYLREVLIGAKRTWLRGFTTISSCTDLTDLTAFPPVVTFQFYSRDSQGSTWGDYNFLHQEVVTLSEFTRPTSFNAQYTALSDFIIFDSESGSNALHYMVNGWSTRQQVQVRWILEQDDVDSS